MTQALFANQRETNLQSMIALIEEVLGELGHEPSAARASETQALHAWRIRKGSALTRVTLLDRAEFTHLRVCSIVMTLDKEVDRPALHQKLLELNSTLCGAAFAIDEEDHVLLLAERSCLDLDRSEVRELIRRVTTYADDHDDTLVAWFGGKMGGA
ncbi:MAG TPA: YbjN domain-containing protein [Kofleriaceae bacterium]|nr:YbjN domain-containing protein [Kofleriaceae bacterium]